MVEKASAEFEVAGFAPTDVAVVAATVLAGADSGGAVDARCVDSRTAPAETAPATITAAVTPRLALQLFISDRVIDPRGTRVGRSEKAAPLH
jgi:hypothetical protein